MIVFVLMFYAAVAAGSGVYDSKLVRVDNFQSRAACMAAGAKIERGIVLTTGTATLYGCKAEVR